MAINLTRESVNLLCLRSLTGHLELEITKLFMVPSIAEIFRVGSAVLDGA